MQHFVTYSDAHGHTAFLLRLTRVLGAAITVLTCKPSICLAARACGSRAMLVTRTGAAGTPRYPVSRTLECITGEISSRDGEAFCRALAETLARIDTPIDCVVSWNGGLLADLPLTEFALARGLPRLFLEIANLPGRVFADPLGTGGDALVATHPEYLGQATYGGVPFDRLRRQILEQHLTRSRIPQQRRVSRERLFAPLDVVASRLARSARPQRFAPLAAIRRAWPGPRQRPPSTARSAMPPSAPYLVYCLQVADDTNVRLRSPLGVIDALHEAVRQARGSDLPLVVCPHPAERCPEVLRRVHEIIAPYPDVHLVAGNSLKWALGARRVIVINSSLGLEVRLAGGEVSTLGRSLYGQWSDADLRNYLERWLVPIDYYDAGRTVDAALLRRRFAELTALSMTVRPGVPCIRA